MCPLNTNFIIIIHMSILSLPSNESNIFSTLLRFFCTEIFSMLHFDTILFLSKVHVGMWMYVLVCAFSFSLNISADSQCCSLGSLGSRAFRLHTFTFSPVISALTSTQTKEPVHSHLHKQEQLVHSHLETNKQKERAVHSNTHTNNRCTLIHTDTQNQCTLFYTDAKNPIVHFPRRTICCCVYRSSEVTRCLLGLVSK